MNDCARCGTPNDPAATFCGGCGSTLPKPDRPPSVHRLWILPAGSTEGHVVELTAGEWSCGRAADSVVALDDPFVSPRHAQFTAGEGLSVTDLGSANGTFLRVRAPVPLRAGDEIRLGRQCLRLEGLPKASGASGGGRVWGSPNQSHRFRLVQLLEGGGSAETLPLADGDYLIGRDEGGMTFPGDLAISGRHAIINVAGEKASLRDLGSANGTFLRLRGETPLERGAQLLLGLQQIRYESA